MSDLWTVFVALLQLVWGDFVNGTTVQQLVTLGGAGWAAFRLSYGGFWGVLRDIARVGSLSGQTVMRVPGVKPAGAAVAAWWARPSKATLRAEARKQREAEQSQFQAMQLAAIRNLQHAVAGLCQEIGVRVDVATAIPPGLSRN